MAQNSKLLSKKFHIGMRIYKTAIASGVAFGITQLFGTLSPVYAVIAVIITMQATIHETVETAKVRILGTIIGVLIGSLFILYIPTNAITICIGIFLILALCTNIGWVAACGISCFAFISLAISEDATVYDGLWRFIDTFIGIVVSLIVNMIFPNKKLGHSLDMDFDKLLGSVLLSAKDHIFDYINHTLKENSMLDTMDRIRAEFDATKIKLKNFEKDSKYNKRDIGKVEIYQMYYENLFRMFIFSTQISIDISPSQGVNPNIRHLFMKCAILYDKMIKNNQDNLSIINREDIVSVEECIQDILLEIEKTGIDSYHLTREEKREVTNVLYNLHNLIDLLNTTNR